MFTINKFKDGQVSAKIEKSVYNYDTTYKLISPCNSYEQLFKVAAIKNVIDFIDSRETSLVIGCLIGQRSDRRFNLNESFDLKIVCDFINNLKFDSVSVFQPHSDVTLALLNNSLTFGDGLTEKNSVEHMVYNRKINKNNILLISPDAGAYKRSYKIAEDLELPLVASNKVRLSDGSPKIECYGNVSSKDCLIIDDLADGGRTFKQLARILKDNGALSVSLSVAHGMFFYGFDELLQDIDYIYTTNSCNIIHNNKNVHQFNLFNFNII